MRALAIGALASALCAAAAPAALSQAPDSSGRAPSRLDGRLRTEIAILSGLFESLHVPPADSFRLGNREVAAGSTAAGTIAVARGDLAIRGRLTGDAIALHGDVLVYPGGSVGKNAVAVDGHVRMMGGIVEGDVRSIRGLAGGILARAAGRVSATQPIGTWGAIKMVIGWFAVLCAMGVGVLLFAERNLDGVVAALELHFGRAFWTGVLAELAAIPALLLLCLALAISIIGILLVPFAVVAYVVALAGIVTLGFLAVARFTGRAFVPDGGPSRTAHLRSLFAGLVIYLGLWLLAAAFTWNPMAGAILRAIAVAGSWVALTFGLGAAIVSRAGTRRDGERARTVKVVDDLAWQTPTPVTGVVAARRPVVTAKQT